MDELERSQAQLGRTLDRARMGEDRDLAERVRDAGERLARQLFGLLRMTRTHESGNAAFDKPVVDCCHSLEQLSNALGAVNLAAVEGQLYINDIRIRLDGRSDIAARLGAELMRHRVGGLTFHGVPEAQSVRLLVRLFGSEPHWERPRSTIQAALEDAGISNIELQQPFRYQITGEASGREVNTMGLTERASSFVDAAVENLGADRMPNPLPIRRVVTDLVDAGAESSELWSVDAVASPFGSHCLRVCLLALLVGESLGLVGEVLQDMGVIAMFHDCGYTVREGAIAATADSEAVAGYPPPFERHAPAGARVLLRQRGFHAAKVVRALAVLQHHRDYDDERGRPHIFARILHVAEAYDALTARTRGPGLEPREALKRLQARAGTWYDPVVVQVLINRLGAYPPGTALGLEDGRLVVSISVARTPETWDKPLCRRVTGDDELVDLALEGKVRTAFGLE